MCVPLMYLKTPARRQQKQYERKEKNLKKKLKQHNTYIYLQIVRQQMAVIQSLISNVKKLNRHANTTTIATIAITDAN